MLKMMKTLSIFTLAVGLMAGCGNSGNNQQANQSGTPAVEKASSKGKVKIEFYQHKREAVKIYDELIKEFEAAHTNIDVQQNIRPDEPTYLKSRAAANDMPDVIGINGTSEFKTYVDGGLLKDLNDTPQVDTIQPAFIDQIRAFSGTSKVYAYPYVASAQTVLYNKKLFKDAGLKPPTTWDEFIKLCEAIKALGGQPLVFGYKDAWTTNVAVAQISGQLVGADFIKKLDAGQTSFKDAFKESLQKFLELNKYGNKNLVEFGYDDANAQFATGKSYMYIQGIWAIPAVQAKNPQIEAAAFALPATNNPADQKMIGGIDQFLAVSSKSKHIEEAQQFVNFLVEKDNSQRFVTDQKLLPTVKGVVQADPSLSDLQPLMDRGSVGDFPTAMSPAGFDAGPFYQEFLMKGDLNAALDALDKEYKKIISRK
jgi:raffinose/stachyose/melibiose transport system substrate-binding protein